MIVIYHANCDDGFGAAWVLRQKLGDEIEEFIPAQYGEPPPIERCRGKPVIVADFSYKRDPMIELIQAASEIVILDHHKTARDDLEELKMHFRKAKIIFDMERSGARLAWDYYSPIGASPPPDLLKRIDDADRWQWTYDDGKFVQAALRSYPRDFEVWDRLMAQPIDELAAEGVAIRRYIDGRIQDLKPGAREANIGGVIMPVCNAPGFFASDLAGELASEHESGCAAVYFEMADRRIYSLRARGGADVSEIAKRYGGGGHKGAAGFEVPRP